MKVLVKKLNNRAIIPNYAKAGDAGMDLTATSYSFNDFYGFHEYGTGLAMEIPEGHMGLIFPRSSISKKSLFLCNAVGVIDSGYRGEIKVRFKAADNKKVKYVEGEKVAQLIIVPFPSVEFEEVTKLNETDRANGGFGSTGN